MATTKTYKLSQLKGDSFPGGIVTLAGDFSNVGATIKLELRLGSKTGAVTMTFLEGDGLTWISATEIEIGSKIMNIAVGTHYSDLQIILATGEVYTPIAIIWEIEQDITQ